MSNFFGLFGSSDKERKSSNVFSLEKLHALYKRLQQQKQSDLTEDNGREQVVETIRQITEALLWGEKNDSSFFDFFCEKNILAEFVDVLMLDCPRNVKTQLLQTLSILVQNIRTKTSLYYIFSNNHINVLIGRSINWNDEEVLAYYITLLKSLAIRLNDETINFFFKPREEEFPLYTEAIRYFNHRDQMIRAAIRTLTLQIYKIEDADMRSWVIKRGDYYFTHLACYTRELWLRLNAAVLDSKPSMSKIKEAMDQVDDLHIYLNDVFAVGITDLNEVLGERLLAYAIYPFLLGALVRGLPTTQLSPAVGSFRNSLSMGSAPPDVAENSALGRLVAIYLLQRVVTTFSVQTIIAPLVETLISRRMYSSISSFCYGAIAPSPASYPDYHRDAHPQTSKQMLNDQRTVHLPNAQDGFLLINPFRGKLLKFLQVNQTEDSELFLATALIYSLLTKRIIQRKTLEDSGLIPTPPTDVTSPQRSAQPDGVFSALFSANREPAPSEDVAIWDQRSECLRELLLPMCQAFQSYGKLRSLTLLALQRTITEILLAQPQLPSSWMPMMVESIAIATRKCAKELNEYLKGDLGDSLVEFFVEQWEAHKAPVLDLNTIMGDAGILLSGSAVGNVPSSDMGTDPLDWVAQPDRGDKVAAFRQLRCFLILRRFHRSMLQLQNTKNVARQTLLGPIIEPLPFDVAANVSGDNKFGLVEGHSIELSKQNRILCDLSGKKGKSTRYLMQHDTMVILVQPDLACAGWGIIRTLCPVRCVEPYIDRGDPRTLNLFVVQPGLPPGEATLAAQSQSQDRPCYSITLTFDDIRRCHCAQSQINSARNKARVDMMDKVRRFVEQHT